MLDQFSRTRLLVGEAAMQRLFGATVAVFGVGGVGGYVVEALARSGVGTLHLVDNDQFCLTNLNRQLHATQATIGRDKVDAAAARVAEINPAAKVFCHKTFFLPETAGEFDFAAYDYVVDAIDTVTGKLALVQAAQSAGTPVISCMGTGNKLNPALLEVADIYETSVCPLARIMRRELRRRGVNSLKVVYSKEPPMEPIPEELAVCREENDSQRRQIPGSTAFVPASAGLLIASEVVRDLIGDALPDSCYKHPKQR